MKVVKRIFLVLLILLLSLPIITYLGIVIANNRIADKIEKDLVAYQTPTNTELVDSISIAAKLTGSGNGMQYMGSILVRSDLSIDELEAYYNEGFESIDVTKQESASLDFIRPGYRFGVTIEAEDNTYYSITNWDSDREETFSDFIIMLLDFDIRGH